VVWEDGGREAPSYPINISCLRSSYQMAVVAKS
jgi:hypothetical protein